MKLKDIRKLIKDEDDGCLRKPKHLHSKFEGRYNSGREILTIITKYIITNSNRQIFTNSTYGHVAMKRAGINNFICVDSKYNMYRIETKFGEGTFFDARKLFEKGKYPAWVKPDFCYSNAYAHVMTEELKATVISGIGYVGSGKPFLHSAILTADGMIIDFNYNLVMSKELYYNLFNFEVLAWLDSDKIIKNKTFCLKNPEIFSGYKSYEINFAFDEVMEKVKQEYAEAEKEVGV